MWTKPWVHGVLVVIVTLSIRNQTFDEVRFKSSITQTSQKYPNKNTKSAFEKAKWFNDHGEKAKKQVRSPTQTLF